MPDHYDVWILFKLYFCGVFRCLYCTSLNNMQLIFNIAFWFRTYFLNQKSWNNLSSHGALPKKEIDGGVSLRPPSCYAWPLEASLVTHLSETMLSTGLLRGARLFVALTMLSCLLWSSHGHSDIIQSLFVGLERTMVIQLMFQFKLCSCPFSTEWLFRPVNKIENYKNCLLLFTYYQCNICNNI